MNFGRVRDVPDDVDSTVPAREQALLQEVEQLKTALASRTAMGRATGLLAAQLKFTTDEAWEVLITISSITNAKVSLVAGVLVDSHDGRLAPQDADIAVRVSEAFEEAVRRARSR